MEYLLCPPTYFDVVYELPDNPHMDMSVSVDWANAQKEWRNVAEAYISRGISVELLEPVNELPDMCFTANHGWVHNSVFVLANYRHRERIPERLFVKRWLDKNSERLGLETFEVSRALAFEGGGDVAFTGSKILLGYGPRTDKEVADVLSERFDEPVIPLRLVDERFYHLDTCLLVLREFGIILYYPRAFDYASNAKIRSLGFELVPVTEPNAMQFVCNAQPVSGGVVMPPPTRTLRRALEARGIEVVIVRASEFKKAGGSVRCLTLPLGNL